MINDAYIQIQGHLAKSGYFQEVLIGEPVSVRPENGHSAAIWTIGVRIPATTCTKAIRVYDTKIRLYARAFQRDSKQVELGLADAVFRTTSELLGEFDLGGHVREIDIGGMYGAPLRALWGYENLDNSVYRICDLDMGIIIASVNETSMAR